MFMTIVFPWVFISIYYKARTLTLLEMFTLASFKCTSVLNWILTGKELDPNSLWLYYKPFIISYKVSLAISIHLILLWLVCLGSRFYPSLNLQIFIYPEDLNITVCLQNNQADDTGYRCLNTSRVCDSAECLTARNPGLNPQNLTSQECSYMLVVLALVE